MNTINLSEYRKRKEIQALYALYVKKDYSSSCSHRFYMELIHWYDNDISIPFMERMLCEYGVAAFRESSLQETLEEAYSAFRYIYKLYI